MTIHNAPSLARLARRAALLLAAVLLGACGSGSSPHSAVPAAAVRKTCLQVSAVLSDGPDPGADPVGYAEAQIQPLSQVQAPDKALGKAISALADAYRTFFASNGKGSAARDAVAAASKRINSFCPGAAS
jgi:hypothetical protein